MSMIWPIALVVFSNIIYQICAKGVPKEMDTMASMTITYLVGAVSTASLVQSAFLAVALIIVGAVLYREAITANKVIGIVICLIGLYFINK